MRLFAKLAVLAMLLALFAGCAAPKAANDFKVIPLEEQARTVTLSDFKGKVVLLDFWATWCGPCREAMPEVQSVWEKYHDKGLEVAAITQEERSAVLAFHKDNLYTYPVYLDPTGEASLAYDVQYIPLFVLIRDGKVIWQSTAPCQGEITHNVENALN